MNNEAIYIYVHVRRSFPTGRNKRLLPTTTTDLICGDKDSQFFGICVTSGPKFVDEPKHVV